MQCKYFNCISFAVAVCKYPSTTEQKGMQQQQHKQHKQQQQQQ